MRITRLRRGAREDQARKQAANSPPSDGWLFAQAIQGNPVPSISQAEAEAKAARERLEWLAQISTEHEDQLLRLRRAEAAERERQRLREFVTAITVQEGTWDAAKHPRGGFPENRGWFSPTEGSGSATIAPIGAGQASTPADARTLAALQVTTTSNQPAGSAPARPSGSRSYLDDLVHYYYYDYVETPAKGLAAINNATLKPLARALWKNVEAYYLVPDGMQLAAHLLDHSLQDNPSDLHFGADSYAATKVKESSEYLKMRNEILAGVRPGESFNGTGKLQFNTGDLSVALHDTSVIYTGFKTLDGRWAFQATIQDRYDFDLNMRGYYGYKGKKRLAAVVGNNMAWSDQFFGVIHNYDVSIAVGDKGL